MTQAMIKLRAHRDFGHGGPSPGMALSPARVPNQGQDAGARDYASVGQNPERGTYFKRGHYLLT